MARPRGTASLAPRTFSDLLGGRHGLGGDDEEVDGRLAFPRLCPQPDAAIGSDGEILDVGRHVRVVALPGHTTGHAGYWIPDAGVLVTGDLIDFENSQGMELNNPRSDFGKALRSLRRAEVSGRPAWVRVD